MATIKSFTSLEQSKKLGKILPLESADMCYPKDAFAANYDKEPVCHYNGIGLAHPCWSLAALLGVMICPNLEEYIEGVWDLTTFTDNTLKTPIEIQDCKDPIDACVAMVEKLHELNLL